MTSRYGDPRRTHRWKTTAARLCATATHCTRCDCQLDKTHPQRRPTVDHRTPLVLGGDPFDPANLRVVCNSCNASMGASVGNRLRIGRVGGPRPRRSRQW